MSEYFYFFWGRFAEGLQGVEGGRGERVIIYVEECDGTKRLSVCGFGFSAYSNLSARNYVKPTHGKGVNVNYIFYEVTRSPISLK